MGNGGGVGESPPGPRREREKKPVLATVNVLSLVVSCVGD